MKNPNNSLFDILPSDDDFLRIFLTMIDDEEQKRLEELEAEEDDWVSLVFEETDDLLAK